MTILDVFVAEERFSFSRDEWNAYHGIQIRLQGVEGDSCSRMLGLPTTWSKVIAPILAPVKFSSSTRE